MGGVRLEIFRVPASAFYFVSCMIGVGYFILSMFLYLSFPVTVFWVSNQAEYFEEYVVKRKREIYPPEEKMHRKELEDFKERMRKKREQKLLRQAETQKVQEH